LFQLSAKVLLQVIIWVVHSITITQTKIAQTLVLTVANGLFIQIPNLNLIGIHVAIDAAFNNYHSDMIHSQNVMNKLVGFYLFMHSLSM
jgi:hypothetical protein